MDYFCSPSKNSKTSLKKRRHETADHLEAKWVRVGLEDPRFREPVDRAGFPVAEAPGAVADAQSALHFESVRPDPPVVANRSGQFSEF